MQTLDQRVNTMLRTSGGTYYDPDTGEVMHPRGHQTKKNMSYPSYKKPSSKSFSLPNIKIPNFDVSKVLNLMLIGGVGFLGYKLYNNFFGQTAIDKAQAAGVAALSKTYVSDSQAKADSITATASSLAAKGLVVNNSNKITADTLHVWMDSYWVEDAYIVKAILGMSVQTFRLVSTAYGSRTLSSYAVWHFTTIGQNEELTLRDALILTINTAEKTKIHAYLSVI
jgi:hypothetical protein